MAKPPDSSKLKKELGLFDVFAIATGSTLAGGFFVLPGIAAAGAGSAVPFAYLLAGLILLPGLLAKAELATAMPRSGGIYFFLDRSMGPLWGTMSGFGTWFTIILKTAFALIGVGAYLGLFFPNLPLTTFATGLAVVFGVINLFGAKKTGQAQNVLVIGLMIILAWFSGLGIFNIELSHFSGLMATPSGSLISTAGLVIVSYMGLIKVASVAGEVKDPGRNLPLGMILAYVAAIAAYMIGTAVMIGVVGADVLGANGGDLTPVATVAEAMVGKWGKILVTVAAVLAFSSVANSGILSASRYPLAMAQDRLLPDFMSRLTAKSSTPWSAILLTVSIIILFVTVLNPVKIAKLASSFMLLMFTMSTIAVIVMREARLDSYDPEFKSPLYPWLQIVGTIASLWMIFQMGYLSVTFTVGMLWFGALWYRYYASSRVERSGAIFNIFERLGRSSNNELDRELRSILQEKGLRTDDPFDEIVARSFVMDLEGSTTFEDVVEQASTRLSNRVQLTAHNISRKFLEGTRVGTTPVTKGVALPHLTLEGLTRPEMVIVRAKAGVLLQAPDLELSPDEPESTVYAIFFLISPKENPGQHLHILAQIARRVDSNTFRLDWELAADEAELKEVLLRKEHFLYLAVREDSPTAELIGKTLKEMKLPSGNLIAVIRRSDQSIIPTGDTVLMEGDRLTILGDPQYLKVTKAKYSSSAT
ncbi:MAG: amino acid permease [Bacteroidetes bacterium]|nr:amino acid permease [Bacteroidota bacterium]